MIAISNCYSTVKLSPSLSPKTGAAREGTYACRQVPALKMKKNKAEIRPPATTAGSQFLCSSLSTYVCPAGRQIWGSMQAQGYGKSRKSALLRWRNATQEYRGLHLWIACTEGKDESRLKW